jgi:hypothetical protein
MDQNYVYATAAVIFTYFVVEVARRKFDPFAPVWVFLFGYFHVYVIQAITAREWALNVRGLDLVTAANLRALWALVWFLAVYQCGIGRLLARCLVRPPQSWSSSLVGMTSPVLVAWGLLCAGVFGGADFMADPNALSPEEALFRSFAFTLLVAGILLIVTGRQVDRPRPGYLAAGILVSAVYVVVWTFNGRRSHALMGVLDAVCAFYVSRGKRPSWPVLFAMAFVGLSVVALAITWRGQKGHDHSASGFVQFASEFDTSAILVALNITEPESNSLKPMSHETEEYGGFLLMLATVPEKSEYDYGQNYLRVFSTFIPRIVWPNKPLFGREQWINAWMAGSELKRDAKFTGPAIAILGATQLNGGAIATLIVLGCAGLLLRTAYEYFRLHSTVPWVQAWWSTLFLNAWFMVVSDDPLTWFYYNWGVVGLPILACFWLANAFSHTQGTAQSTPQMVNSGAPVCAGPSQGW